MDVIKFYRANEKPHGAFSNLFRRPITFEGEVFPTSEHAYQAGKARRTEVRTWLMAAPTPALLAMAAHGLYPWDVAPGWSKGKLSRMRAVLRAKFEQHDDLARLLVSTGSARLVEAATVDNEVNRFWGEVDGRGRNQLGELLMELRSALAGERQGGIGVPASSRARSDLSSEPVAKDGLGELGASFPEHAASTDMGAVLSG